MKIYLLLFSIYFLFISDLFSQIKYKDNIQSEISSYAGVYEGYLDVSLCCDVYETSFGTIVFYYDGESLKCLYDGLISDHLTIDRNIAKYVGEYVEGQIFGKFVKSNDDGFLYYYEETDEHPAGSTSFLKKIGDSEMASKIFLEVEKELKEFEEFGIQFRKAFVNKNEKELISMINLPFYDKREILNIKEFKHENELKSVIRTMLKTNLDEYSFKYQNSNRSFGGLYTIQGDLMFFYFQKIGTEFKLVYITNIFG